MDSQVLDMIDVLNERSRWALGIASLIAVHPYASDEVRDAADRAARDLEQIKGQVRRLEDRLSEIDARARPRLAKPQSDQDI